MRSADHETEQGMEDVGTPRLLLVAAIAVLAGVLAVIVVDMAGTVWALALALLIVVAGLVAVSATMVRQMDDAD